MTPELREHLRHMYAGSIRPDVCLLCRVTWYYRTPAQRIAYARRRFHFGRG